MKFILFFLTAVGGLIGLAKPAYCYEISEKVFENKNLPFIPHSGQGPFDSYVSMQINHSAVAPLLRSLMEVDGLELKSRGEAHITVITPAEYNQIFRKQGISIGQLNNIVKTLNLQSSKFQLVCIGRGRFIENNKEEYTYYLVVDSPQLINIRKTIHEYYIKRGGKPNAFAPEHFYPHITLGFTKRDLHESDGVIKDSYSCWRKVLVRP